MTPNRRIGAVRGARPKSTTGGRARPKVPMHGDAQLKLNLEGLNGYAAMIATMKERGYESEGEEDEETGKPLESPSVTSQSANANAPNAAAANAKKQGKKKKKGARRAVQRWLGVGGGGGVRGGTLRSRPSSALYAAARSL